MRRIILAVVKQRVKQTKGTQALMARLANKRIQIKVRDGEALSSHYTAGVQSKLVETKQGSVHSKFLLVDRNLVVGSTNFTTSSQCNVESSTYIRLTPEGSKDAESFFETLFEEAEAL